MNMSDMRHKFRSATGEDENIYTPIWGGKKKDSAFQIRNVFGDIADDNRQRGDRQRRAQGTDPRAHAHPNAQHGESGLIDEFSDLAFEQQLAEAYRKGVNDGQRLAEESLNQKYQESDRIEAEAIEKLANALQNFTAPPSAQTSLVMLYSVKSIITKILGENRPDEAILKGWCAQLAGLVNKDMDNARLLVHPLDKEILADKEMGITVESDPNLTPGTVMLSHGDGWVEKGSAPLLRQIDAMMAGLGGEE